MTATAPKTRLPEIRPGRRAPPAASGLVAAISVRPVGRLASLDL